MGTTNSRATGNQDFFDIKSNDGKIYTIDMRSTMDDVNEMMEDSEKIKHIWVYKVPLSWWQLTDFFFNHQFVVMETTNWFWSFEKIDQEIIIQRSKELPWVRNFLKRKERDTRIKRLSDDTGSKSMKEVVLFLYNKDKSNTRFDWEADDCKHFAKRVFDEFAKEKYHGIVVGSN